MDPGSTDLVEQTRELLEPGDIELVGLIVETSLARDEEPTMIDVTIDLGDLIAEHLVDEEVYIYSGNDDPRFASNQHQALTLDGDDFVWECQQLLVEGTYVLVFYYEVTDRQEDIIRAIADAGYGVTGVST